ncbi:MAG TPA: AAA family ATPase [Candidatus Saccharibacteria bacterium]|nr:AAA family ATPase [Candidatus Saccharibacteria bacterium]HRQ07023.1 AAA family ATPase [Candidatus Saccharibacteria bacterium]
MTLDRNVKIIAFVGLAGSGKSAAAEYLASKDYPKVYFGGVMYELMKQTGIEQGEENERKFRVEIRKEIGADFAAKEIVKQIHGLVGAGQKRIVADGLYSWDEYKIMKREFPGELTIVAVVSPKRQRHNRLTTRPERPLTNTEANERDWSEIEDIQKGGPIAIADYYVINDSDLDNLHAQIDAVLEETGFNKS